MIFTVGSREGPLPAPPYGPLLDALPDAVLLVNQEGDVVEANDAALDLFGRERRELVGRSVERVIPGLPRLVRDRRVDDDRQPGDGTTALASVCRR